MKRLLRYPMTNVVGISLFTGFYALVFFLTKDAVWLSQADAMIHSNTFWASWQQFLMSGHHRYIVYAMIALTAVVIVALLKRNHSYDEYHTALLISCLTVASILTLLAIAAFYLLILVDSTALVSKFTLFIVINWVTVVLLDLVFVFLCRWR